MVREVGFEPTNPYGTGASGLRIQDPEHTGLFDLAWQHEPPQRGRLPQTMPDPRSRKPFPAPRITALIGFLHPTNPDNV